MHDSLNTTIIDKRDCKKLQNYLKTGQMAVCQSIVYFLWYEGVFVVVYLGAGGSGEDYCNDVETVGAVLYVIGC